MNYKTISLNCCNMMLELLERKYWIAKEDDNYDEMWDILRRMRNIEEMKNQEISMYKNPYKWE